MSIERETPRALAFSAYRAVYESLRDDLEVGKVVPGDIPISIIGNNTLRPSAFNLRRTDMEPIGEVRYPGKSAHISFTTDVDHACRVIFGRSVRRQDHLYTVNVGDLLPTDYIPIYAPLLDLPLHLRLVYKAHLEVGNDSDIPERSKNGLVEVFNKHKVK